MINPSLTHTTFNRTLFLVLLVVLCLPIPALWAARDLTTENHEVSAEYGKVIYRTDSNAPSRLYIIANSHRSSATGANGSATLQAQIETFRIAEQLIRQQQVDLLLPEGFFGSRSKQLLATKTIPPIDQDVLAQRLVDTTVFTNAELLLYESHDVSLQQVEDRPIYNRTRDLLHSGLNGNSLLVPGYAQKLDYLQKLRTATILQRSVPALLGNPQQQDTATAHNAILTLGLSHLDHIITYLNAGEIRIQAPLTGGHSFPSIHEQLELSKAPVDVTVIVPRSLLDAPLLANINRH